MQPISSKLVKRCAYLTMRDPGDFVTDYDLSFAPMAELGWQIECVAWDEPTIDWDRYDAVYICTPWDYPEKFARFLEVLETIDRSSACLINDFTLCRWTLEKTYLRDLAEQGAAIVPSLWYDSVDAPRINSAFTALGSDRIVVKPQIGVNSMDTFVLDDPVAVDILAGVTRVFADRPCVVQPFMANVVAEGEYSLFFFDGKYSHAILKTPRSGDFRSQEEHGAAIASVTASDRLVATASRVMDLVEPVPAYARADFLRDEHDRFLLMELELVEPSLYLRTDAGAAARFAAAVDKRFQVRAGK